jgi:hypothetical protein
MVDPHTCIHNKLGYCTWEQKFCAMTEPTWNGEMWCWMELQQLKGAAAIQRRIEEEKRCESKR